MGLKRRSYLPVLAHAWVNPDCRRCVWLLLVTRWLFGIAYVAVSGLKKNALPY